MILPLMYRQDNVLSKYNKRIAGLTPGDPEFISIGQFGKEFYEANKNDPKFRHVEI